MPTRTQLAAERMQALLRMIAEGGASGPGNLPPAKYVEALNGVGTLGKVREVAQAHKQGSPPPEPGATSGGNA